MEVQCPAASASAATSKTVMKCNPWVPVRSADGTCNNVAHPHWGSTNVPFTRLMPPAYEDGMCNFIKVLYMNNRLAIMVHLDLRFSLRSEYKQNLNFSKKEVKYLVRIC